MEPLLQTKHIGKSFSGERVLNDISVDFFPGRVHVLLGENGAGKSTLIKIISGIYQRDEGDVILEGKAITPQNPREGIDLGISVIHQELSIIAGLSVAENIFIDNLPLKYKRFVDFKKLYKQTKELMDRLGIKNINPRLLMRELSVADCQMVEIMRAVSRRAKVVIMDEPTSSLSDHEIESLFTIVENLKQQNVAVIYITHKLKEITRLGDDISIFKDGELVCTRRVAGLEEGEMVRLMVGREIGDYYIRAPRPKENTPVLKVENLSGKGFSNISFELNKGEVLGFSGLIGAGRTEVMRAVFGADRRSQGTVLVRGEERKITHPRFAIEHGIGLVPEDRRKQGVYLDFSVRNNISIVGIVKDARKVFLNFKGEARTGDEFIKKMRVKTSSAITTARKLSGGNQQKVILARWLASRTDILILDEPTRGIDVNAKREIYGMISDYVQQGGSIILVSSELPELIGVSHRVVIMRNGHMTGIVSGEDMTEEVIMGYATRDMEAQEVNQ